MFALVCMAVQGRQISHKKWGLVVFIFVRVDG